MWKTKTERASKIISWWTTDKTKKNKRSRQRAKTQLSGQHKFLQYKLLIDTFLLEFRLKFTSCTLKFTVVLVVFFLYCCCFCYVYWLCPKTFTTTCPSHHWKPILGVSVWHCHIYTDPKGCIIKLYLFTILYVLCNISMSKCLVE